MEANYELSIKNAVKLYKVMRCLEKFNYNESIKAIYEEMNKSGIYFSLLEKPPEIILEHDKTYKWIKSRYKLILVKKSKIDNQHQIKILDEWWSVYVMSKKDILEMSWEKYCVDLNETNCDLEGLLEACCIKIDRRKYFIQNEYRKNKADWIIDNVTYYEVDLLENE